VIAAIALAPAMPASASPGETVAEGLRAPTNLAFASGGRILFTEQQTGRVRVLVDGRLVARPLAVFDVAQGAETGLLGLALAPGYPSPPDAYVYLSNAATGRNEIVRFSTRDPTIRTTVFRGLPWTNGYHNGGDLAFGEDGMLYAVTGEAHDGGLAQDPASIGGKVLRLSPDGTIPPDNPFGPDDPVYALGIRNSFGLCVDPSSGALWETENGPDRDDEVNRIEAGANYGWPTQLGAGGAPEFSDPALVFPDVIVPTGCAVSSVDGALYFGDYGGGALHRAVPTRSGGLANERVVFRAGSGITDVAQGPDGSLYLATTDAILRVDPASLVGGSAAASSTGGGSAGDRPGPRVAGSDGGGLPSARSLIVVALFILLGGALTLRFLAGRRAARESRTR
jgi:glucose/arabinose dehydrogenase